MGTKDNPSHYDCYAKALPDEPLFTLLARDRYAPALVRLWADLMEAGGVCTEQIAEARQVAMQMTCWVEAKALNERKTGGV